MQYSSLLIIALVMGGVMLRRAHSLITRQVVKPMRLMLRLGIYSLVGLMLLVVGFFHPWSLVGDLLGLAAGLALAWCGLRLTTFEETPAGLHFTPNKYIGLGVFALLLVRVIYRMAPTLLAGNDLSALSAASSARADSFLSSVSDPITAGVLFIIIGYYTLYYGAILLRHRQTVVAR